MSTLGVLTLSNAEKPHQHLAFNIESPYGSYLLDRFQMTSRWPMTKNRRPWICTERILWGLTSFLMYKLTFVPTNLHSLLATWVKSLYQIVSHDLSSAIFVYKKMKLGHACQVSEKILGGGGDWIFVSCKNLHLFQDICPAAGHVNCPKMGSYKKLFICVIH